MGEKGIKSFNCFNVGHVSLVTPFGTRVYNKCFEQIIPQMSTELLGINTEKLEGMFFKQPG